MQFDGIACRTKAAATAREEFKSNFGFEIPDEPTNRWLANSHEIACCGVATGLKDKAKSLNLAMVNAQVVPLA